MVSADRKCGLVGVRVVNIATFTSAREIAPVFHYVYVPPGAPFRLVNSSRDPYDWSNDVVPVASSKAVHFIGWYRYKKLSGAGIDT